MVNADLKRLAPLLSSTGVSIKSMRVVYERWTFDPDSAQFIAYFDLEGVEPDYFVGSYETLPVERLSKAQLANVHAGRDDAAPTADPSASPCACEDSTG
jgi:hypothetical protein